MRGRQNIKFMAKVVEKIKIHISCSVTFIDNPDVYEIMWKNMVKPDRQQSTL